MALVSSPTSTDSCLFHQKMTEIVLPALTEEYLHGPAAKGKCRTKEQNGHKMLLDTLSYDVCHRTMMIPTAQQSNARIRKSRPLKSSG